MNIKLHFISKNFKDKKVFDIKNYKFSGNTIHGIVGPNGSGKTTLLRMIANLDNDYSGNIYFEDSKFNKQLAKEVTWLSQNPYMLNRTVYENIAYPLKVRGYQKDEIDKKVNKLLKLLNIKELKDIRATNLSAGETQKVSLARGIVFKPKVLLLDEPTANIDPNTVELIEKVIREFQIENNTTVIVVTHNLSQALRLCDTISILKQNEIIETTKELIYQEFKKLNNLESFITFDYKILGV